MFPTLCLVSPWGPWRILCCSAVAHLSLRVLQGPRRPLTSPQAKCSPEFPICIWGLIVLTISWEHKVKKSDVAQLSRGSVSVFVSSVQGDPPGQMLVVRGEECLPTGPCWSRAGPRPFSQHAHVPVPQHNARPHFLEPASPSLT